MKYADAVKERVDALLEVTGLKATDLIAAMGISSSTYYDMWRNGYITVDRLAWPYLGEGVAHKGVHCLEELHRAAVALNVVARETNHGDAVFRRWKALSECLQCLRAVALRLRDLYLARTQGVQRHQMEVLVRRCNALLVELRDYGTAVDTSKGYRPSPYAVT